eukprot:CAMPEP_0117558946 /NCGR_PEP_ID=MMETSP0784-20121206/53106_1 /TAXON_ID=39447 /ORGANISM="" /LENGTH=131 /DNA_ID=CAMNT_0005356307 /DNA_START=145 /DNA_END=540 /DNA_ORIENTATION=-
MAPRRQEAVLNDRPEVLKVHKAGTALSHEPASWKPRRSSSLEHKGTSSRQSASNVPKAWCAEFQGSRMNDVVSWCCPPLLFCAGRSSAGNWFLNQSANSRSLHSSRAMPLKSELIVEATAHVSSLVCITEL